MCSSDLNFDRPPTLEKLKIDTLKCDNRYWERQHEKGPAQSTSQVKPPPVAPTGQQNVSPTPQSTENSSTPRKDLGNILGADGKLTEAEKEWRHLKNLCMYFRCPFDKHNPLCRFKNQPPPATGCATFILTGDPTLLATIEEVSGLTPSLGN